MSIFNFLKDVGHKLAERGKVSTPEDVAQQLQEKLAKLDLGLQNTKLRVEGDKAVLEGRAPSQEAYEKAVLAIGNTAGIAQVEARLEGAGNAQPQFYTVKKGDTLSKIARETLGSANRYPEIFEANRPLLKDPDEIFPGQQLRIPAQEKKAA